MGCGSSKVDDLPLVELCRERKDLIRAAADHRYALVSAHVSYFQALNGIGEALHRFVQEELTVVSTPSSSSKSSSSSPVLTIPSSEGKPKPKPKPKPNPESSGAAAGASSSSPTSLSHSLSPDDFHHLHLSSGSVSETSLEEEEEEEEEEVGARWSAGEPSSSFPPPFLVTASPNYYYMRHSNAIPSTVYESPYPEYGYPNPSYGNDEGYFGVPVDSGSGYPPYGRNEGYFGVPTSSSSAPRDAPYYYYERPMGPARDPTPQPPPPPPPPEGSTWDFLNPFGSYEQIYSRYGVVSQVSSPNSSEVREQEGIPDLEEETEPEPMKGFNKVKKMDSGGEENRKDSGAGSSKPSPVPVSEKDVKESLEKEIKSSPEGRNSSSGEGSKSGDIGEVSSSNNSKEENVGKKEVSFEVETSPPTEKSWPSIGTALSTQGTKDVTEVVMEINEQFKKAAGSGEEVSAMLEVGKLRYQSRNTLFRVIFSRILDSVPILTYSRPSSKRGQHSGASTLKMAKATGGGFQKSIAIKSGNLLSTLDKLCVWEKKLYKQVKDEERLRVEYEKKCKLLKVLDYRGAEPNKIESTEASIKKLLTKLDIAIKSIDAISDRIHKLRDEELQPQLTELIQGLIKMWKFMLDCHQKQFLAIVESKSRNLMAKTGIQRSSVAKATIELELELLNWSSCFNNWISIQKSYVEALNGWLLKCLHEEQEETPDGVPPFSPGRIGAPSVFIVCHDWCQAVNRISEVEVSTAMRTFAATVHELWETQDEEQRQKLKAEYLSRDLSRRLKSLQKESVMHRQQDPSGTSVVSVLDSPVLSSDDHSLALDLMRKRLEEERARHEETVKQVHKAASNSLRTGLIPIFGALGNFSLETLKAYEGVRIPRVGEGT